MIALLFTVSLAILVSVVIAEELVSYAIHLVHIFILCWCVCACVILSST